jgi:hypothetical protein
MKKLLLILIATATLAACDLSTEPLYYSEIVITKNCVECVIEVRFEGIHFEIDFSDTTAYSMQLRNNQSMEVRTLKVKESECYGNWNNTIEWYDREGYNLRSMNCIHFEHVISPN